MNINNKKIVSSLALLLFSCCLGASSLLSKQDVTSTRQLTVLAVNDLYNIEGVDAQRSGGMARLRELRNQLSEEKNPVLMLHAGDFLFPSSMSSQYKGEQMIDLMNLLDGQANSFDERFFVTFGNHEFDKGKQKYASLLGKRIEQSDFYWLGSNISLNQSVATGKEGFTKSLLANKIITINGIRVGLFSITTNMATPSYAQIDNDYLNVAKHNISQLKQQGAEVIIAVTHLMLSEDKALLEALGAGGPDVILGGHEHNRLHACIAGRCVIKADADGRSATIAKIVVEPSGNVNVSYRYSIINQDTIAADPIVQKRTQHWLDRYEQEYCDKRTLGEGCLNKTMGKTAVNLVAEELEIRRFETNLGAFVAQQMIDVFDNVTISPKRKVQVALINSGSLRLNQNIPANTELTQWHLNGIFQYPVSVHLIDISGAQLKAVLNHSIEDWSGNGWWLQSAGIAFRHDVENQQVSDLHLVDKAGHKTLVTDEERIVVAVSNYIVDPSIGDQDGYTMLNLDNEIPYGKLFDLKTVVSDVIKSNWRQGKSIAPKLPGRVCSSDRPLNDCILDK